MSWLDSDEARRLRRAPRGRPARVEPPGPGQESVWDYPRPPRLEQVAHRVRVEQAGVTVADTACGMRVCETASPPCYYFPPEDVRMSLLEPAADLSLCEWKGEAHYWHLRVDNRFVENAAWSYPDPAAAFASIRDWPAFFAGRVDACWVGDARVTPQPGGFYGGWVTPELVGPFKGEPGTMGW